jgi:hypothetical protein
VAKAWTGVKQLAYFADTIERGDMWWKTGFLLKWEGLTCTHQGSNFFLFGEEVGWEFIVSSLFPMCSRHVPMGFLSSFQRITQVPKLFLMMLPKVYNSRVYKLKRWAIGEHICFYFAIGGSFKKKRETVVSTPMN